MDIMDHSPESTDISENSGVDYPQARRIESLFDPLKFDELYSLASKVFLSHPVESSQLDTFPLTNEAAVVQQLGTRGLRTAYEISHGVEHPGYPEKNDGPKATFPNEAPLLYPEYFSGELDRQAILQAEQLGDAMMDEMFKTLGQDAYVMAEKLKNATSEDEELDVIEWLDKRLDAMAHVELDALGGMDKHTELNFYHPIRLSAKIIGTYPNQNVNPTCLGVSIAAAGFFKRAGLTQLHAGVMSTRMTDKEKSSYMLLEQFPKAAEAFLGEPFHPLFLDRLEALRGAIADNFTENRGYHAMVLSRLKSGRWVQFDSNYRNTVQINFVDTSTALDDTYEFLEEIRPIAPGLEVTQKLESFRDMSSNWGELIIDLKPDDFLDSDTIKSRLLLIDPESESLGTQLFDAVAAPFFEIKESHSPIRKKVLERFHSIEVDSREFGVAEPYLLDVFGECINRFFLEDNLLSLDEYLERCQADPHFLERATEDFRHLPLMMGAFMCASDLHPDKQYAFKVCPYAEVGLPAARIGLAALSDLAAYSEISLSPTFWLSNWPSLIPIAQTSQGENISPAQHAIIHNNLGALSQHNLLYDSSYGIISEFLSEITSQEGDSNGKTDVRR
jgi:hypothetical protein